MGQTYNVDHLEHADLHPESLAMPVMKEIDTEWLVGIYNCLCSNPQFTVNGSLCSGITAGCDGIKFPTIHKMKRMTLLNSVMKN